MTQSEQLFEKSEHFLPGGVNSPVRAFRNGRDAGICKKWKRFSYFG